MKAHAGYLLAFAMALLLSITLLIVITNIHERKPTPAVRPLPALRVRKPNAFGGGNNDFCEGMSWIHTPKTSSTLCLTLQHICCKKGFELTVARNKNLSSALYSYTNYTHSGYNISNPYDTNKLAVIDGEFLLRTKQVFLSSGCVAIRNGDEETPCRLDRTYSQHKPFNLSRTADSYRRFVFLVRDPLERLISSYADSFHHEGMDGAEYRRIYDLRNNRTVGSHCDLSEECFVAGYVYMMANWRRTHALGCQVKMLNGYACFESVPVTQAMVDNAVNLISNKHNSLDKKRNVTFYSGVFERYNESIRYLHRAAGKGTAPLPIELVKFRDSAKNDKSKATKELLRRICRENKYADPYDEVLYRRANQILDHNVKILNL